jgi:ribosomal protein S17E
MYRLIKINPSSSAKEKSQWAKDLESGKVLFHENFKFAVLPNESKYFTPEILSKHSKNISLDLENNIKGVNLSNEDSKDLINMISRFRSEAKKIIISTFPKYRNHIKLAPTSFRPIEASLRKTSWRADDTKLHVDAFPSRPTYGTRILRVFININPKGKARIWRIGENIEAIANKYLDKVRPYSPIKAKTLYLLGITKSLRSEFDHIMLELHDLMKKDLNYQKKSSQICVPFKSNTVWICFSDQVAHAAMSGQYVMEQTFYLNPSNQYNPEKSPLELLNLMTGKKLI